MADIDVTLDGRVQIIRFNRALKKNAITRAMYKIMANALITADINPEIGATVLFGQPEIFTSGNDLLDFMSVATGGEKGTEVLDFLRALITGTKPLVAGVDGLAVGIGTTMLMHCDLVYASSRAVLHTPFVDLGVIPENASSLIAPRIMGSQNAFALLAMGEKFTAERAQQTGLVCDIVEIDKLENLVLNKAAALATKPPEALAISRRLLRGDRNEVIVRMEEESALFYERLKSEEAQMAFANFLQKKAS